MVSRDTCASIHAYTYTFLYIYIYISLSLSLCVCSRIPRKGVLAGVRRHDVYTYVYTICTKIVKGIWCQTEM